MKLKLELEIDADQTTVWNAFENLDNRHRWQAGVRDVELMAGEYGQPGSVLQYTCNDAGRELKMIECVTERREPEFIATQSDDNTSSATTVNLFERIADDRTRWVIYANYSLRGVLRFAAPFYKRTIVRGIETAMHRFKLMVETDASEAAL